MGMRMAGMGYGWGVRYNDELEVNEANLPHLEIPQFPIQGDERMNIEQELVKVAKELVSENTGLGLEGMTKAKATKFVNDLIRPHTKGLFKDIYWEPIGKIWKVLTDANVSWELKKADYIYGQGGKTSGKEWKFEVYFRNNNQNFTTLYGVIVAAWAGSVKDPSDKYDLVAYVS